ncbi:hypothetical protein CAL26_13215 [Bordetella genomosp. 9]|uniref:Uncharacterized protein n=1 Tax=Bordetella genomosp. 9 TaxID=1416803 RepID=A0A261R2V5_9BORD|nr:hypothetical protein [Bordetella genomosp. 9]OZI18663.1 hypothetical protein CAL26_13215 [Bordetella genomosp. 9]
MQDENVESLSAMSMALEGQAAAARAATPARALTRFLLMAAAVWVLLDACYQALPLIRPGADVVLEAKFESLVKARMFSSEDRARILVFGNSKTLAGFRPEQFDAAFKPGVHSYNLGLPGDGRILPILNAAITAGNIPTHVFLTIPWDSKPRPTLLDRLRDDETILYTLIPFRDLPRDLVAFVATSHFEFRQRYEEGRHERDHMLSQRGWYFIKGQSFFPSGELPDDYAIPTDHPAEILPRDIPESSFVLDELERLSRQHGFKVILVPGNMRMHAQAAPPAADAGRDLAVAGHPGMRIVGPDYWIYPPKDYSDAVHLNPLGATAYTSDLARLVADTGLLN